MEFFLLIQVTSDKFFNYCYDFEHTRNEGLEFMYRPNEKTVFARKLFCVLEFDEFINMHKAL